MKKIITLTLFLMLYSCSEFKFPDIIKNVDISDEPEVVEEVIPVEPMEDVSVTEIKPEPEEMVYSLEITDFSPVFDSIKHNYKKDDKLAVVGSSVAKYYPYIELNNQEDLKLLGDGKDLEMGTIINIIEVVEKIDTIHESFFRFEKDNNFFYKTVIEDKEVLVWGADLISVENGTEAVKTSWYYNMDRSLKLYKPFNGPYNLTSKEKRDLKKNRITKTVVEGQSSFIDLYLNDSKKRNVGMFFTSDFIFHVTNRVINEVKEDYFTNYIEPQLVTFIDGVLKEIDRYFNEDNGKNPNYSKKLERVYKYFLVAKLLINHVDDPVMMEEHLRSMPGSVIDEYYRILAGESRDSLILDQVINYGAIDGNGVESNLYLCLEWLSVGLTEFKRDINQTRVSLIVYYIITANEELNKIWQKLNSDIRYLSLSHDSVDINMLQTQLSDIEISIFPYWVEDDENLISVNTLVDGTFSLFSLGHRMDNKIPEYLSSGREEHSPLDIMALMGSKSAYSLIKQDEGDAPYWLTYERGYKRVHNYISSLEEDFWNQSIYTELFGSLKYLSVFEQSRDFYFMEKAMWNQKVLLSGIGAWADIISVTNKSYMKKSNVTDIDTSELSFRVEDIPLQQHFVEPNLDLYSELLLLVARVLDITDNKELKEFKTLLELVIEVTVKEISGEAVDEEDNTFLSNLPSVLAKIIDNRVYSTAGDVYEVVTDVPYRWSVALDDDKYGKRVLTGYGYSINGTDGTPFWVSQVP